MTERDVNLESNDELDLSHLTAEDQEKVRKIIRLCEDLDHLDFGEEYDALSDEIDKEFEGISSEADDVLLDLGY